MNATLTPNENRFIWATDFCEELEIESKRNWIEVEKRQEELSKQLEELLKEKRNLTTFGFGVFGTVQPTKQQLREGQEELMKNFNEVWKATRWLLGFHKQKRINIETNSYKIKHIVETMTKSYISNGAMIAAAFLSGRNVLPVPNSPNAWMDLINADLNAANAIAHNVAKYQHLVQLEPRLKLLATEAIAYRRSTKGQERICANERWYGYFEWEGRGIKKSLETLVGWKAENSLLKTSRAYDVAYDHIYKLLPHCKNCLCY